MKKISLFIILSLVIVTIFAGVFLRNYLSGIEIRAVIPPRPDSIPKTALWVGGPDGGVYVLVKKNIKTKAEIYGATIYSSSGSIEYKGDLIIHSTSNRQFNYTDVNSYSGWSGDTLYLIDGRMLSIVK